MYKGRLGRRVLPNDDFLRFFSLHDQPEWSSRWGSRDAGRSVLQRKGGAELGWPSGAWGGTSTAGETSALRLLHLHAENPIGHLHKHQEANRKNMDIMRLWSVKGDNKIKSFNQLLNRPPVENYSKTLIVYIWRWLVELFVACTKRVNSVPS